VIAQRIWLAQITIQWVTGVTTSRYIWVVSQDLIKFILEKHYILSGNIPDTPRERVPQITRGIGERVISSLPRSTCRRETWYFTYASTSALCFKVQSVFARDIWDQILFYFIYVDDLKPLVSSLGAVYVKSFQTLGIIQSLHSIDLSGKSSLYLFQKVYFLEIGWSWWPHWGAII